MVAGEREELPGAGIGEGADERVGASVGHR
jgi:hypothetical protein